MKNKQVAQAFYDGETAKTENMFIENYNGVKVVYSYGYHFPIAIRFIDGFLFNSDGYSVSTSRHKNLVLNQMYHGDLTDDDYKTTNELKAIVDKIKYNDVKSKAELIEQKI